MIVFPNAKINIGLNVVSKREDGYHNLETLFFPINLCDALEMAEAKTTELSISGIEIDGNPENNLILKAYFLLKSDFDLPPVRFHLHKKIPFGAGLGGGSADAAFTLKLLNNYFALNLSSPQLEKYAAKIGADCPFFIQNKPTFATGIGDEFQDIELDLKSYEIVVLKPYTSVGTAEAYRNIVPALPQIALIDAIEKPISTWKQTVFNDFEKSVFPQHPEIESLKKLLYELGAEYASMSGSGSAVFGIFSHFPSVFADKIPNGVFIYRHHSTFTDL